MTGWLAFKMLFDVAWAIYYADQQATKRFLASEDPTGVAEGQCKKGLSPLSGLL